MEQKPQNPLSKHFRQPAIYIKLPSNGQYWPEGSLDIPATGEIPVYPMTARDEITLRTPDALLNGQGVVDIIQSCCPNIKDAWKMPSVDVDAVLLNIRVASYGSTMDFDTTCPKCNEESNFALDVGTLVETIAMPNYSNTLRIDGLDIKLKPQPYFEVNKTNQLSFTEQQIIRTINDSDLTEMEKKTKTDSYLQRLIDLNIDVCANSTESITLEDGVVVDNSAFIREFFDMADYKVMRAIQKRLEELNEQVSLKPVPVTCSHCSNKYNVPLNFDYANFFA